MRNKAIKNQTKKKNEMILADRTCTVLILFMFLKFYGERKGSKQKQKQTTEQKTC